MIADVLDISTKEKDGTLFNEDLYLSSLAGQFNAVRDILAFERGNPNGKNKNGFSPLHAAAFKGFEGVVQLLVLFGANVNEQSNKEETPLHFASLSGFTEIAAFLISKGAEINSG